MLFSETQLTSYNVTHLESIENQSRICGEGVRSGHFLRDSLESKTYDFDEIAHMKALHGVERRHESSLESLRVFEKIEGSKIGHLSSFSVGAS